MSRMVFRNKQAFWYARFDKTVTDKDTGGFENGAHATYTAPVKAYGNISPASGVVAARQFGDLETYDKVIVLGDRDTPIDEHTVLWIDCVPEINQSGELKVNANGDYVTPWDYIVRRVGRGLPNGSAVIMISKVSVT